MQRARYTIKQQQATRIPEEPIILSVCLFLLSFSRVRPPTPPSGRLHDRTLEPNYTPPPPAPVPSPPSSASASSTASLPPPAALAAAPAPRDILADHSDLLRLRERHRQRRQRRRAGLAVAAAGGRKQGTATAVPGETAEELVGAGADEEVGVGVEEAIGVWSSSEEDCEVDEGRVGEGSARKNARERYVRRARNTVNAA